MFDGQWNNVLDDVSEKELESALRFYDRKKQTAM